MKETFVYDKLRGRIREVYGTEAKFANAIGLGRVSFSKRLNNAVDFTRLEILNSCEKLSIHPSEVPVYFFTKKVQVHEQA